MSSRSSVVAVACWALILSLLPAANFASAAADSITLTSSKDNVKYGKRTQLAGEVSSGQANEQVSIVNESGKTVADTVTTQGGSFSLKFAPKKNVQLRAVSGSAESSPVTINVLAVIRKLRIKKVRLFDKAFVVGKVKPGNADIAVELRRKGTPIASRTVSAKQGHFSTGFAIKKPGRYNAGVTASRGSLTPDDATTAARKTPLPGLGYQSRGIFVRLLEKRLNKLNYRAPKRGKYFNYHTADAVMAFHKVQGMPRFTTVSEKTWRRLASPRRPHPKSQMRRKHVEVDQSRQIFYLVKKGRITDIVHASTGAGNATRNGRFKIYKKGGQGRAYYPSYFDGARAFHAWDDVPPSKASHGCVRLPWWAAKWYWRNTPVGTPVIIYR